MTGTQYKSDNPEWRRADANMTNATLMKCISVGNGGVWAINAKDNGVMCRLENLHIVSSKIRAMLHSSLSLRMRIKSKGIPDAAFQQPQDHKDEWS